MVSASGMTAQSHRAFGVRHLPRNLASRIADAFDAATWTRIRCRQYPVKEQTHVDSLTWSKTPFPLAFEIDVTVTSSVCDGKSALFNLASAVLAVPILECVDENLGQWLSVLVCI